MRVSMRVCEALIQAGYTDFCPSPGLVVAQI